MAINMFLDGGFPTWLVGALSITSVSAAFIQLRLAARTRFPGLNEGLGAMLGATAIGGALLGQSMAMQAVSSADDESKALLMSMGTGISVLPIVWGAMAAVVVVPLFALVGRQATRSVKPARAMPYMALASAVLLITATGTEASWAYSLFTSLPFTDRADPAGIEAAATALQLGIVASGGAMILGMANVFVGIIGGLRGLYATANQ